MKNRLFPLICAGLAVVMAASSCGGQKQVVNAGKTEISIPFNAPQYRTDADYFRATASGTSTNMEMARTAAELNARNELAAQIEIIVKSVSESYMIQRDVADRSEFGGKLEQGARQVVNQVLRGATIKDTKLYQSADGSYEYWVNIEMHKSVVVDDLAGVITNDEKLALDFDKHLFMKTFEEEMDAYAEKNSVR